MRAYMCILKKILKRKKKEEKEPEQECWYNNAQDQGNAVYAEGGGISGNAHDMAIVRGIFSN
jgi:hypothetical protein